MSSGILFGYDFMTNFPSSLMFVLLW